MIENELNVRVTKRVGHTKPKLPSIPLTMPGRYSVGNVLAITGWSHTKLYKRIQSDQFPKPLKDGKINYWTTDVIRSALGL